MSFLNVRNNAFSTLAAAITSTATSFSVAAGEGARFPASNFLITIGDEIILCTSRTTDTFTVVRAQGGTTAAAHSAGARVELRIMEQHIIELQQAVGWDLIRTGTFTADVNITGLDGNADKLWKLIVRTRHTASNGLRIRFNSDAGANYNWQRHTAGLHAAAAVHSVGGTSAGTEIFTYGYAFLNHLTEMIISSLSGQRRLVIYKNTEETDGSNLIANDGIGIWVNTIDNITTINMIVVISTVITAGEYWLFRQRG
jgi:hypothetical protein